MGLSIGSLLVASILFANGLAILNEDRFLKKVGWGYEENLSEPPSLKKQVINLLYAVRVLLRGGQAPASDLPRGRLTPCALHPPASQFRSSS